MPLWEEEGEATRRCLKLNEHGPHPHPPNHHSHSVKKQCGGRLSHRESVVGCSLHGCLRVTGRYEFCGPVVAAPHGLCRLLCHLPVVRSAGFLQHRAADGGQAATRHGGPEAGVPQPQLHQRRVLRTLSGQGAGGQQVWRVGVQ